MYELRFYALDGASVREGIFKTKEEADDRWADIGSRWIFYPVGAIFYNGRCVEGPDMLEYLKGMKPEQVEEAVKLEAEFLEAIMSA